MTSDAPASPDTLDQSRLTRLLGFRITRTELRIRRLFLECMARFELKPVDYSLLVLVDANPGVNQRQLAEILDVSPPNLAIVVARLMKRGLLRQVRGQQDRRMQHLHLTAAGKELLDETELAVREMEARLLEQLGPTHGEALLAALARLEHLA
ncbi:MarR family transcriptional regulator [Salinicola endophyticus]|uniref:MarR family transcriptional regulator n=1 Tax=Salinicola endophyticus TaxID=1949083 RepID=A0ABY8FCZ7_9GAMM|nr:MULTISPECIES: MarR family transcriptional regulator [Salinicola]WFF40537.1 MarR family transcriptional regulator [Salinicola endophyticus]